MEEREENNTIHYSFAQKIQQERASGGGGDVDDAVAEDGCDACP